MKRLPRAGDDIIVLSGSMKDSIGRVRKVYKNGDISAAFKLDQVQTETAQLVSPDGTVHYILSPGEYDITGDTQGVF